VDCDVIVGAAAAALGRAAEREVWAKAKRVREGEAGRAVLVCQFGSRESGWA
jgi:hypothetical protein